MGISWSSRRRYGETRCIQSGVDIKQLNFKGFNLGGVGRALMAGASVALVIKAIGAGSKYIAEILYAHMLGPEQYGVFSYGISWAQLVAVLAGLGFTNTVLRFIPQYIVEGKTALVRGILRRSQQLVLIAGTGLTLAISVLLYWEGSLLREYGSALLVGVGCVPLLALVNTQSAIIRSKKKIGWATISTNVLQPVIAVILTYTFLQVWEAAGGLIAVTSMAVTLGALGVLQWIVVQVFFRPQMGVAPSFHTRRWMTVAFPLLVIAGFQIVLNRTDVLMVGTLLDPSEVGKYNAALRTGGLISFVLTGFNAIAAPLISQYWSAGDLDKLREAVEFVIRWTLWSSLFLVIGMSIVGEYILMLFGTEFTAAYWTLIIVSLGQLVNACAGPVGYIMALTGHERTSAKVYGAMALINVPLNYMMITQFGSIGAAIATTLTLIGWNLGLIYLTIEKVNVNIFRIWKRVLLFR